MALRRKTVEADYVPNSPMFILLSNSVSSRFGPSGEPDEKTVFPNDFEVEYVRVYQPRRSADHYGVSGSPAALTLTETKAVAALGTPVAAGPESEGRGSRGVEGDHNVK